MREASKELTSRHKTGFKGAIADELTLPVNEVLMYDVLRYVVLKYVRVNVRVNVRARLHYLFLF